MVFDCNQTPKCHPALNPEKAHLNFDCKLKNQKQKHLVTNFVEKLSPAKTIALLC